MASTRRPRLKDQIMSREAQIHAIAEAFADRIHDATTEDEFAEIKRLNATEDYKFACASHDFMDANIEMDAAFCEVMGRDADAGSYEDAEVWNRAWDMAKSGWLTCVS